MEHLSMYTLRPKPPTLSLPSTESSMRGNSNICRQFTFISFALRPSSYAHRVHGVNKLSIRCKNKIMPVNDSKDVKGAQAHWSEEAEGSKFSPPLSNVTAEEFAQMDDTERAKEMATRLAEFGMFVSLSKEEEEGHERILRDILENHGRQGVEHMHAILSELCLALRSSLSYGFHWSTFMPFYNFTQEEEASSPVH